MRESFGPTERVRAIVEPAVPNLLDQTGTRGLIALAVVGSAARGEETVQDGKLVSDIDLAAVVQSPDPFTLGRFDRAANVLGANIDFGCFPLYSLRRYRTLEFYEAKQTAWVVWGSPHVFQCVRVEGAHDIPKLEGLRLLLNRAMDCLRARTGLLPSWYAAVKTYLALAEADLVFTERYVPSYRGRWKQLEITGEVLGSSELLDRVRWATQIKLNGDMTPELIRKDEHEQWLLRGLAQLFSRYLGNDVTATIGLESVSRGIVHPVHRAVYLTRHFWHPRQWGNVIWRDPVFSIWEHAIQILNGEVHLTESALRALLNDWKQTHQPLPT